MTEAGPQGGGHVAQLFMQKIMKHIVEKPKQGRAAQNDDELATDVVAEPDKALFILQVEESKDWYQVGLYQRLS